MFKQGIMAPLPMLHPFPFHMHFPQSFSDDSKVFSWQLFVSTLNQVPVCASKLKLPISENLCPIIYKPLNHHANVYNM